MSVTFRCTAPSRVPSARIAAVGVASVSVVALMPHRMRAAGPPANGTTSGIHGLPLHAGAVALRRLALVALERAGEVERVAEAGAVADLLHGEVREAQQPRRLEHDPV